MNYAVIYDKLRELDPATTTIIEGGAKGADYYARTAANVLCLWTLTFKPDEARPSPQRYHERNDKMLELADRVIAFWDGKSRGTKSVIEKARKHGIPVEVVRGN